MSNPSWIGAFTLEAFFRAIRQWKDSSCFISGLELAAGKVAESFSSLANPSSLVVLKKCHIASHRIAFVMMI
jgi:hypothetical protein